MHPLSHHKSHTVVNSHITPVYHHKIPQSSQSHQYKFQPLLSPQSELCGKSGFFQSRSTSASNYCQEPDQWSSVLQQNDPSLYHHYPEPLPLKLPAGQQEYNFTRYRTESSQCSSCDCDICQDDHRAHRVACIQQHPMNQHYRRTKQYFSNDPYGPISSQYNTARNHWPTEGQYLPESQLHYPPQLHLQDRPAFYQHNVAKKHSHCLNSTSSLSPVSSSSHYPFQSPSILQESSNGSYSDNGGVLFERFA